MKKIQISWELNLKRKQILRNEIRKENAEERWPGKGTFRVAK